MATNTFTSTLMRMWGANRSVSSYTWRLCAIPWNGQIGLDRQFAYGTLGISGWIRDSGGTPLRRLVELTLYPSGQKVARIFSDPSNGGNNYFFNELQPAPNNERYVLTVYNDDGSTAARVKDARVPV